MRIRAEQERRPRRDFRAAEIRLVGLRRGELVAALDHELYVPGDGDARVGDVSNRRVNVQLRCGVRTRVSIDPFLRKVYV